MKKIMFVIFLFVMLSGTGNAVVVYVDNTTTSCSTPSDNDYNPANDTCGAGSYTVYNTIQAAVTASSPGWTILVASGTYQGLASGRLVNVSKSASSVNPIIIQSESSRGAILDCQDTASSYGFYYNASQYVTIKDFEIKNCGVGVGSTSSGSYITIQGNKIHHMSLDGMYLPNGSYFTIDGNEIYDVYTSDVEEYHGIYFRGTTSNSTIQNNIIYDIPHGWPIHLYWKTGDPAGNQSGNKIINNTFADASSVKVGHIMIAATSPSLLIQNNISYNPRTAFIQLYKTNSGQGIVAKYNLTNIGSGTYCYSPSSFCSQMSITNNVNANPNFTDAANRDYTLTVNSTGAINGGLNTNAPTLDYAGITRGNPPEIGAYEYGATADTEDPSIPADVVAADTGTTTMTVTWSASTDNVGVTGYKVYRDTVLIYSGVTGTSYNDSGLTPNTSYSYTISAYDAAGNESAQSSAGVDATDAIPGGGATNYDVVWGASATSSDCSDFSGANSLTVGDAQTWKILYDYAYLYICASSTDTGVAATCSRDGSCWADDAIELWLSPTHNVTGSLVSTDIQLVISANNEKYDADGTSSAKDIPMYTKVTIHGGGYYIWARIPLQSLSVTLPKAGTVWGFLASETNGSVQVYVQKAWPVGVATYTVPSSWGTMTFGTPTIPHLILQ